ncbi:MAG TPA: hypothetical protein VIM11_25705 [Tepidisphaeraceae bacterium]|jgi:hypothetical protein
MANKASAQKTYEAAMSTARNKLNRRLAPVPAIRFGAPQLHYASYDPETAKAEYASEAAAARSAYDAATRRITK